jgi:membrane protease YdiL (CAAX protease family)
MRLFWLLLGLSVLGLAGSAPYLISTFSTVPLPPGASPGLLVAVSGAQVLGLAALASFAGVRLAPRAGLDAPWLRAIAERSPRPTGFASLAVEAAALGSLAAVIVAAMILPMLSFMPAAFSQPPRSGFWTLASSAFYGGIDEEILVRWGLLSAVLVLLRKVGARDGFWIANLLVALVFGAAHLPTVAALTGPLTAPTLAYTLLGNFPAGLFFGWLFRRKGLESAMIAHGAADVWLHAALPLLLA